jgi:hypothetical protein
MFLFTLSYSKAFKSKNILTFCSPCQEGNCQCFISGCDQGSIDIYTTQGCFGTPKIIYDFYDGAFTWYPTEQGTYYLKVLCEEFYSECTPINIIKEIGPEISISCKKYNSKYYCSILNCESGIFNIYTGYSRKLAYVQEFYDSNIILNLDMDSSSYIKILCDNGKYSDYIQFSANLL